MTAPGMVTHLIFPIDAKRTTWSHAATSIRVKLVLLGMTIEVSLMFEGTVAIGDDVSIAILLRLWRAHVFWVLFGRRARNDH